MKMYYPVHSPQWVQKLFPKYKWCFEPTANKTIYLTFDDGPIPEITPWVLEELAKYKAKATFFCVGANIQKNPTIYQQLLDEGHQVGNHTFSHKNGWASNAKDYLEDIAACQELMETKLFRPPYGRLWPSQAKAIREQYKIVMWDVISGDFDYNISGEQCWQNVLKYTQDGSIILLHDSKKAWDRLQYVLPRLLEHYTKLGFNFEVIGTAV